jgi:hypothetical protein
VPRSKARSATRAHFNSESKWVAKIVANNADHVVPQVDDTQYECDEEQKGSSEAEALWCIPWSDIKVFPLSYADASTIRRLADSDPYGMLCFDVRLP